MRSLRTRVLLSASLVLITFLGGASVLLDRAFRDSALNAVEDRLRGRVFMLIGAADFDAPRARAPLGSLPDPNLAMPGSGHYLRLLDEEGKTRWESRSLLGLELPLPSRIQSGTWRLERTRTAAGEGLFSLVYGIIWEGEGRRRPRQFVIQACENENLYVSTVRRFRRSLWLWFAGLSVSLLVVQTLNLHWGLRPLRQVDDEVRAIEAGSRDEVTGSYPLELHSLTRNLNRLLHHNRDALHRYRNALGDLAHSIKTPLAVLRNELGSDTRARDAALEQIGRIDRTVEYHLHRAAAAGRSMLAPPVAVEPVVQRLLDTLRKVHAQRGLELHAELDSQAVFFGDEGDLLEIVGNLADNACKWARKRVRVQAQSGVAASGAHRLELEVSDDGPGIPEAQLGQLMQRGTRLDQSVEGHGIGLAIVRDMVEDVYRGRLSFESSAAGTRAHVEIDFR
jgi:two-component system sensor histidine kinase PhoQ